MAVEQPRPVNAPNFNAASDGQGTNSAAVPADESASERTKQAARRAGKERESLLRRDRTPAAAPDVRSKFDFAAEPAFHTRHAAGGAKLSDGKRAAWKWSGKEPCRPAVGSFHDFESGYAAEDSFGRRFACAAARRSQSASADQRAGFGASFALSDDPKRLLRQKMIVFARRFRPRAFFGRKQITAELDQIFRPSVFSLVIGRAF